MTPQRAPAGVRPVAVAGPPVLLVLGAAGAVVGASSGIGLVWFIPYAAVGSLLVVRRPRNPIGWLLLALAWAVISAVTAVDASPERFAAGEISLLAAAAGWLQGFGGLLAFYLLATLAITFPSGRLPRGRRRGVAWAALLGGMLTVVASMFMPVISVSFNGSIEGTAVPNPFAILPDLPLWSVVPWDLSFIPLIALLAASVISLLARFRTATGIERQQLRWIAAALALLISGVLGGFVAGALIPGAAETGLIWIGPIIAIPLVPVAIGIAVLRYRLYEIDRIISRTISWAITTGLIAALFGGSIVMLQALLASATGESTLVVAGSTLAAAAAFQPVRRRVQGTVDHRFNRSRYDAERIVDGFAGQLRAVTDLDEVRFGVMNAVARSLHPSGSGLWIRSGGAGSP